MNKKQALKRSKELFPNCKMVFPSSFVGSGKELLMIPIRGTNEVLILYGKDAWKAMGTLGIVNGQAFYDPDVAYLEMK